MITQEIIDRDNLYVANTYARFPVAIVSGKSATCYDAEGKEYIDLTSGIGVNAMGFSDHNWAETVYRQARTLQHTSNLFYTSPCGEAAEKLCKLTGMKKVFFGNSGAEANECAIKCARKYSFDRYGSGRSTIVTLVNSFHGRTVTTLSATGQDVFHKNFSPFTEGFVYAAANDLSDTLLKLSKKDVCAVMIEMIQGEGGVLPLEKSYVTGVADYCAANDILLLIDEVQTGVGRTGTLYAYMQYGISPDVVTSAKGLAGGLPVGVAMFSDKTENVLQKGDHATTFGGTPIVCAAMSTVLSRMTSVFLSAVKKKGDTIRERLLAMPHVISVSGLGLMIGVTLEDVSAKEVVLSGIQNGVLTLTAKEKLRLLPPLSILRDELDEGLLRLNKTLSEL